MLVALALTACRPIKDPARPSPPPLPAAPSGTSTLPAVYTYGDGTTGPFRGPDPDVIVVDPSFCASIPTTPGTTTTTEPLPPAGAPGCYYAYSTPTFVFLPTAVPVSRSRDLVHWFPAGFPNVRGEPSGVAFDGTAPGAAWPLWAPSVLQTGANRYVMWFSEMYASVGRVCLWSASATSPDGPFTYDQGPLCNTVQGGVIDPAVFVDTDGSVYLTYKGEGSTSTNAPIRIFEMQLAPTADRPLAGTDHQLLEALPAPSFEFPNIEAPTFMRAPGGSLFLFYSASSWFTAGYEVAVAKCDSVAGPCNRVYSTPVLASRDTMLGPGGPDAVQGRGRQLPARVPRWDAAGLATNPIDGSLRSLRILPLTFPGGSPKIG